MKTTKYTFFTFLFFLLSFVFTTTFAQVTFKNGTDKVLLQVNDYVTAGTLTLPAFTGILPDFPINNQMLYNIEGTLYWNGSALGTSNSAAGWMRPIPGGKIYPTDLADNVGIGTNNPLSKLSVGGEGFVDAAVYGIESQTGNIVNYGGYFRSNGDEGIGVYGESYASSYSYNYGGYFVSQNPTIGVGVHGEANGTISRGVSGRCTSTSGYAGYFDGRGYFSGNLGIGSTSPNWELTVQGTGYFSSVLRVGWSGPSDHILHVEGNLDDNFIAKVKNNSNNSAADGVVIDINNSNPGGGNRYLWFRKAGDVSIGSVSGNGGGVAYNTTSDARLKMNIIEYSNALETVSNIGIKKYERISNPGIEEIGVIAQELQKVYPQAVSGSPESDVKTDPMMVDYSKLTPLLVKGMQEQQERIISQNVRIKKLEERLAKLESLLDGKRFTSVSK